MTKKRISPLHREADVRDAESTDDSIEGAEVTTTASAAKSPSSPPSQLRTPGKMIEEVERAIHAVEAKTAELIADADIERTRLLKRKMERDDDDDEERGESSSSGKRKSLNSSSSPPPPIVANVKERGRITSMALKTSLEKIATDSEDASLFCWNCGREVSCNAVC